MKYREKSKEIWVSKDQGKDWRKLFSLTEHLDANISSSKMKEDGSVIFTVLDGAMDYENKFKNLKYYNFSKEGILSEIKLEKVKDVIDDKLLITTEGFWVEDLAGKFYLCDFNTGKVLKESEIGNDMYKGGQSVHIYKDQLIMETSLLNDSRVYNINTGQLEKKNSVFNKFFEKESERASKDLAPSYYFDEITKGIYIVEQEGMLRYSLEEEKYEKLIVSFFNKIGKEENSHPNTLYFGKKNEFFLDVERHNDKSKNVFGKVLESYTENDKVYAIPNKFDVYGTTAKDVGELKVSVSDYFDEMKSFETMRQFFSKRTITDFLYYKYIEKGLDNSGQVDKQELQIFCKQLKKLHQADENMDEGDSENVEIFSSQPEWQNKWYKEKSEGLWIISGKADLKYFFDAGKQEGMEYQFFGHEYRPFEILGVNEKSGKQDVAKGFVEFALTKEIEGGIQESSERGFSISGENIGKVSIVVEEWGAKEILEYELSEEEKVEISKVMNNLSVPINIDSDTKWDIIGIADRYVAGELSIEAAVNMIDKELM